MKLLKLLNLYYLYLLLRLLNNHRLSQNQDILNPYKICYDSYLIVDKDMKMTGFQVVGVIYVIIFHYYIDDDGFKELDLLT